MADWAPIARTYLQKKVEVFAVCTSLDSNARLRVETPQLRIETAREREDSESNPIGYGRRSAESCGQITLDVFGILVIAY